MKKIANPLTVWLLQTGEPLHIDLDNPRPMRAMNLANALVDSGHKVILWSSAFYHQEKRHRVKEFTIVSVNESLEIRLIPSPGYQRNIGAKRLLDHAIMARNLKKYLGRTKELPDIAFLGYPPIEVASVMGHWLKKKGVKYLIDVKDQWPTLFIDPIPGNFLKMVGRLILSPYFYYGKKVMNEASGLCAMSQSFVNWANKFAGVLAPSKYDIVAPLTNPIQKNSKELLEKAGRWWDELGVLDDNEPRIFFVGSHSQAFDIQPIIEAATYFQSSENKCQFVICGDGPFHEEWKGKFKNCSNVLFPGWVSTSKSQVLSSRSIAALAPYKNVDNFISNLPNKVLDYLSYGKPILSPLKGEVYQLIQNDEVGLSYGQASDASLIDCINELITNSEKQKLLSNNARRLFENKFSYQFVYGKLVEHLEAMSLDN